MENIFFFPELLFLEEPFTNLEEYSSLCKMQLVQLLSLYPSTEMEEKMQFLLLYAYNRNHFCDPQKCEDFSPLARKQEILQQTPAGCLLIQYSSDTLYLEIVLDPTG